MYGLFATVGTVVWAMGTTTAVLILWLTGMIAWALVCALLASLMGVRALIWWTWAFQHSPWGALARSAGKLLLQTHYAYYLPTGTKGVFGLQTGPQSYSVERVRLDVTSPTTADVCIECARTRWDRGLGHHVELRIVTGDPQTLQGIAVAIRSCLGADAHFLPSYHASPKASEQQAL
jgi:hypothetical protein